MFGFRRRYFFTAAALLLALVLAASLVLSLAFGALYEDAVRGGLRTEFESSIHLRARDAAKDFESAENLFLYLRMSSKVLDFINQEESDPFAEHILREELRALTAVYSRVHSIAVFNKKSGRFAATVDFLDEGAERAEVERIAGSAATGKVVIRRQLRRETPSSYAPIPVISFYFPSVYERGRPSGDCIVIDVLNPLSLREDAAASYFIMAPDGSTLADQDPLGIGPRGDTEVGSKYLSASAPIGESGLVLRGVRDPISLSRLIQEKRNAAFLLGASGALLFSLAALLISRRLAAPITLIGRRVDALAGNPGSDRNREGPGEIGGILDGLAATGDRLQSIERTGREQERALREMELLRLLTEGGTGEENGPGSLPGAGPFRVALLILRGRDEELRPIVATLFPETEGYAAVKVRAGRWAVIADEGPGAPGAAAFRERLNELVERTSELGADFALGIGSPALGAGGLRLSYSDARANALSLFCLKPCASGDREEISALAAAAAKAHQGDPAQALIAAFKACDPEAFAASLRAFGLRARSAEHTAAASLFAKLLFALQEILETDETFDAPSCMEAIFRLDEFEFVEDMEARLSELFSERIRRVESVREMRDAGNKQRVFTEAERLITEGYPRFDLTADGIGECLGYSGAYFSKLYKELSGISLNDRIRALRIAKARELLSTGFLPVAEIAARTGFSNQNYFYHAFRRETGMTPMAYRASRKDGGTSSDRGKES